MKINIVVQYEGPVATWDGDNVAILGTLHVPENPVNDDDWNKIETRYKKEISEVWRSFQKTHPDSDSQFCEFLRERGYSVSLPDRCGNIILDG